MLVDSATGRVLAAPKLYDAAQAAEAVQAAKVGVKLICQSSICTTSMWLDDGPLLLHCPAMLDK